MWVESLQLKKNLYKNNPAVALKLLVRHFEKKSSLRSKNQSSAAWQ